MMPRHELRPMPSCPTLPSCSARQRVRCALRDVMRMSRYPRRHWSSSPNDNPMKLRMRVLLSAAAFVAVDAHAADDCSFVKKVELPSRQQIAVVSSGALEPCSTGSYAVRVYSTAHTAPGFDTDDYVTGVLHARDGTVADAFTADLGTRARDAGRHDTLGRQRRLCWCARLCDDTACGAARRVGRRARARCRRKGCVARGPRQTPRRALTVRCPNAA